MDASGGVGAAPNGGMQGIGAAAGAGGGNGGMGAGGAVAMGGGGSGGGSPSGGSPSGGNGGDAAGGGMAGGGTGGIATDAVVHPPAAGAGDLADGVAQLNLYRSALGLEPVTFDEASSVGCEGHLLYLIEEAEARGQGYLEHTESNQNNSHYSAENEAAGRSSDLAYGGGRGGQQQNLAQAVDLWINGLYHRWPLLDPGLIRVGAASNSGYNCLNYGADGNQEAIRAEGPVFWPADTMTDVPRAFGGNEGPCPTAADPLSAAQCDGSGFIVSASFYGWGTFRESAITSVTDARLIDTASGMPISLFAWYADGVADHDPAPGYVADGIALVPADTLAEDTTFRVEVDAVVGGEAMPLSWTFTTGTRTR